VLWLCLQILDYAEAVIKAKHKKYSLLMMKVISAPRLIRLICKCLAVYNAVLAYNTTVLITVVIFWKIQPPLNMLPEDKCNASIFNQKL
jgi:hypothetical protein